jgi:COMPASS component SWD3
MRSIYGPHLCGDALSIRSDGREALTASWRDDDALQRWDLGTGKVIETIHWNGSAQQSSDARPKTCMLYGCAYSPDELTIAAGGCGNGVNQAKLFDNKTSQPTERVTMQHGVYCLAFAPSGKKLAIGGVDQAMSIINLE